MITNEEHNIEFTKINPNDLLKIKMTFKENLKTFFVNSNKINTNKIEEWILNLETNLSDELGQIKNKLNEIEMERMKEVFTKYAYNLENFIQNNILNLEDIKFEFDKELEEKFSKMLKFIKKSFLEEKNQTEIFESHSIGKEIILI